MQIYALSGFRLLQRGLLLSSRPLRFAGVWSLICVNLRNLRMPGCHLGCLRARFLLSANAEINFRNGGCAEGSLARHGGRSIPRRGGTLSSHQGLHQPGTPRRASPSPSNSLRIAWEAARAQWPVCGVIGTRPRSWTLACVSSLEDRPFRLGHLEISFGISKMPLRLRNGKPLAPRQESAKD